MLGVFERLRLDDFIDPHHVSETLVVMVDGSNGEPAMSEEDVLAMEEVYRFRLLGVKRVRIEIFNECHRSLTQVVCICRGRRLTCLKLKDPSAFLVYFNDIASGKGACTQRAL